MFLGRGKTLQGSFRLNGVEVVHDFVYLRSTINDKGNCKIEIRRRIQLAKTAINARI